MIAAAMVLLLAQPPASACTAADEPEFAVTKDKPVQVGGGAMFAAARERRYLDALRGPMGETVQYRRTGSEPAKGDRITFLDRYEVTYTGLEKPVFLYLDAYHFDDALKAPRGFTCAVPFGLAVPGPDPMLAQDQLIELAVEQGPAKEFAPISLDADGSALHGVVFDRFRMLARAARSAAAAGKPIDPERLGTDLIRLGTLIVAYPLRCGDKDPAGPATIDLVPSQGRAPQRVGELATGETLARFLPGTNLPAGSVGAMFTMDHPRATDSIKVSYAPGGCGDAHEALLPLKFSNARPVDTPMPALPAGQPATDRPIRLQAILDHDGAAQRIVYIGGPPALTETAIAAVRGWKAEPMRMNGAPLVTPVTFQVKFGGR